jgi:hypothetical protein
MALKLDPANKNQVILVGALVAILFGGVIYVVYDNFFSSPTPRRQPVAQKAATAKSTHSTASAADGPEAKKLSGPNIDPALHLAELAMSEDVEYAGTGRNIFSADSAPMRPPEPIAPPRPGTGFAVNTPPQPPAPPRPPTINLKYFGYTQDHNKIIEAYFVRGDDVFIAKPGDIIDHQYKIGVIQPANAEVTDLNYNSTQSLPFIPN